MPRKDEAAYIGGRYINCSGRSQKPSKEFCTGIRIKEISMMNIRLRIISVTLITAFLLSSALAQGKQQQKAAPEAQSPTSAAGQGGNTPGRIAKFTTPGSVSNSNIIEDDGGKIGIGTTLPTSQLTVNGVIELTTRSSPKTSTPTTRSSNLQT
jgi:hypothetical protein